MTTMTTDVMTASRPSAGILAEIEARAVDAPTEDGDWCAVDERGVYSPVQIEISTWTEVVDEYGDSIDEDDPVAVARGQKAQRSEVRVYDPVPRWRRGQPVDCGRRGRASVPRSPLRGPAARHAPRSPARMHR
jgi:hypothetical protein